MESNFELSSGKAIFYSSEVISGFVTWVIINDVAGDQVIWFKWAPADFQKLEISSPK